MSEMFEGMYKDEHGIFRYTEDDGIVFGEPNLDEKKTEAVKTRGGYVRVIAGAGSGKTRALTYHYAYLAENGTGTDRIACITFTKNAAEEMKTRIRKMLPDKPLPYISTFHSLGNTIIREEHASIRWCRHYNVMGSDGEVERILTRIYKSLGIKSQDLSYEAARRYIIQKKSEMKYIRGLKSSTDHFSQLADDAVRIDDKVYYRYLAEQKKEYLLDYTDMVCIPLYIFKQDDDIRRKWAKRFIHVMVDEFQDVSELNYRFCKELSSVHHNLFVVGDPDQTIYSWRGAKVEYFIDFTNAFPDVKDIELLVNWRSNQGIVEAANRLISKNVNRLPKEMEVSRLDDKLVNFYHAATREDEAKFVVAKIKELKEQGVPGNEIAILYRVRDVGQDFNETLKHEGINCKSHNDTLFYESREIQDLLSYLRLLVGEDDEDVERAILMPPRNICIDDIEQLKKYATEHSISLFAALKENLGNEPFTNGSDFVALIEAMRERKENLPVKEIINTILSDSGMEELLRDYSFDERLSNIAKLKGMVSKKAGKKEDGISLEKFLSEIEAMTRDESSDDEPVLLMTIHAAKGKEFDYVFVVGMNEGFSPSSSSSRTMEGMEEERRIAYVAFTRAKEVLYISDAEKTRRDSRTISKPSRFIFDADYQKMNLLHPIPEYILESAEEWITESQNLLKDYKDREKNAELFKPKDWVEHKEYGKGVVLGVNEDNSIDIEFEDGFTATLTYTKKLKKLGVEMPMDDNGDQSVQTKEEQTNEPAKDPQTILELIDQVALNKEYKNKISALPLMCGTGKSSAISQKIVEVIKNVLENNSTDGILIVSDTIAALEGYVNPVHQPKINRYIHQHMDQITVLHSQIDEEIIQECYENMPKTPVLIITTQRYFGTTKKNIVERFLTWEKGKRTLVLIDEQPYFVTISSFGCDELNKITEAFSKGLSEEKNTVEKAFCLRQWKKTRDRIERLFKDYMSRYDHTLAQDYFMYDSTIDDDDDVIYSDCLTENDERFYATVSRNMMNLNSVVDDFNVIECLNGIKAFFSAGGITVLEKGTSDEYNICAFSVVDNFDKVRDIGAKVIVLDGTADVSPAYDFDYIHVHHECDRFNTRRLDNLTINVIDLSTSKYSMRENKSEIAEYVNEYLQENIPTNMEYGIFTYKEAENYFAKVCNATVYDHFGHIKGRNDFANLCHIAQVGLNRFPPAYYFMYLLHIDRIKPIDEPYSWYNMLRNLEKEDKITHRKHKKQVSTLVDVLGNKSEMVYSIIFRFILADIEQNLFRMKIRRNDCTDDVCYYIFIKTRTYHKLIVELARRLGDKHGAHIVEVSTPVQAEIDKMMRSPEGRGYKKLLEWMRKNETDYGRVFSTKEVLEETGLTQEQFTRARRKHEFIRAYFELRKSKTMLRPGNYENPLQPNKSEIEDDEDL